jgi:hypothetical protein
MRYGVRTATNMKMSVLRTVASCSLVDIDRRFRGAYHSRHQRLKRLLWSRRLHGATSQKSVIFRSRFVQPPAARECQDSMKPSMRLLLCIRAAERERCSCGSTRLLHVLSQVQPSVCWNLRLDFYKEDVVCLAGPLACLLGSGHKPQTNMTR